MKLFVIFCLLLPPGLRAQQPGSETAQAFDCYVQAAEVRMDARKEFVLPDTAQKVRTVEANGPNPHKLPGGQLYDWIGTVFIPGTTVERLVRMLQDYEHRPQYFPETISSSKLLCRTGTDRFQYSMRMKEPAVLDVDSDVVWARLDAQRWRCRSLSTRVKEAGKDHGYLRRLNSYWRFAETPKGVFVEAETITLSDEFGSVTRMLGSALMGINPEKSLRHSLTSMRESVLKPGLDIPQLPTGVPACGEPVTRGACPAAAGRK
jgi:hypothetical protein